jgi:DNA-directed RNA polymerase specialized sigma24 family protein
MMDLENQAEVLKELRPTLMKLVTRMLGREVEAEDIVQEADLRWQPVAGTVRCRKAFLKTMVTGLMIR